MVQFQRDLYNDSPLFITRFAPAPTGWLHLGHVRNAHYVWQAARTAGGRVLLRIDDHDRTRSRPEFEAGILDDLDWLGYAPAIFPTDAFRAGPCEGRQTIATPCIATRSRCCARRGSSTPATARAGRSSVT